VVEYLSASYRISQRRACRVVQIHLPGRVAQITDPLLALILAAILGLSERLQNLRSDSLGR
jgi:surfactin synthase thioesterase subunit